MLRSVCLWAGLCGAVLFTALASVPALASTIDSTPFAWESSHAGFNGPDVSGGTFTADALFLNTFSLFVGLEAGVQSNDLRAVVLATDASGMPTGTPLWQSVSFQALGSRQQYTWGPGTALTLGEQYFVGIDSGQYTGAAGGDFTTQVSTDIIIDLIPGGQFWWNDDGTGWLTAATSDITTIVVMSSIPNPEPGTAGLLGLGLVLLGMRGRRLRRTH